MRKSSFRFPVLLAMVCAFGAGTANAATNNIAGAWSPVYGWPLIPVHAVLMPDKRLLTYGTDANGVQTGNFIYDVWDSSAGMTAGHLTLPNQTNTDIFCSSQVVLPQSNSVFIAGGDNWTGSATTNTGNNNTNLFNYSSNTLTRSAALNRARWYSSSIALLNGAVYVQGGSGGTDRPEVRNVDGTFTLLTGADTSGLDFMYPRNYIAPDGRIFGYDSNGRMYYVNPAGSGSLISVGSFTGPTGSDASAVMFRPGRILQFGGNSNAAVVIDINGDTPTVTPTQSMVSQRRLSTATVMADGKVLATGGSPVWNDITNAEYRAEIWNPATGTWTIGATGVKSRLYHSMALLLPDATVLVGGGGAPGPQVNTNAEIYFPPYLFDANGNRAVQPSITSAPTSLAIGQTFPVGVAAAGGVSRVTLVKTGSVTHGWNMEQRFIELAFTTNGSQLMVQAPARAADAPPGYYLLFVIDAQGVPSVAAMLRMNVAAVYNPAVTPTLGNPGNQIGHVGAATALQLLASDPNGDILGYAASGLPSGLSIDPASGLISGTPLLAGTYNVVVAVSDGINAATASFVWSIDPGTVLTVEPLAPTLPAIAGGSVSFTASTVNAVNPRYRWNFNDGTPETAYSSNPQISHTFSQPGIYYVSVTATDDNGLVVGQTVTQLIHLPLTANRPGASSNLAYEPRSGANARLWVVNQDNDSVSVFDAVTNSRLAEIAVGSAPRSIGLAPSGELWVTNKQSATVSVINPSTLAVSRTIALPRASQPFGIVFAPSGGVAYVALEAAGLVLKLNVSTYSEVARVSVGASPRQLSVTADGATLYVSRFITPPLVGEGTATVQTATGGGEVLVLNSATMGISRSILLRHSDKADFENQGGGIPNYLGATTISPDGTQAWVPSKQDNIRRGTLRSGLNLNFQNTVRAISSRVDLATQAEDYAARIDHDNSSVASAIAYDRLGVYMFVALETSREIAVVSAHGHYELYRIQAGHAPQGLMVSADGLKLYVNNFMDRSVAVYDLDPLLNHGVSDLPLLATLGSVGTEKLSAQVLLGKQLFYDAKDPRLARDSYMSCAACHNDGGQDGRVWDLTGQGEGLRNTIALRGRAGAQGFLHWSGNFDEVQDFEGQIRTLAGGTGLMSDAAFQAGTRSQPLGDAKSGQSASLDALAAYVSSLNAIAPSPNRNADGSLTTAAVAGQAVFRTLNCASCHAGTSFTNSAANNLVNIGTLKPSSGQRLGGPLTGIDVPTLRDVWASAPYLHDGSAATLSAAVRAHNNVTISDADLVNLSAYLQQIGSEEVTAPVAGASGLTGRYFTNTTLSGTPVLTRIENVNFNWGSGSPGAGVPADKFSVRWTGFVQVPTSGSYRFRTVSDDGVRLWVAGVQRINHWNDHGPTTDTTTSVSLTAGVKYAITMEFYENGGGAVAQLSWRLPGQTSYVTLPSSSLYAN